MRTSQTLIFGVLIVSAGHETGCSSDGTGPVPPGALHASGGSAAVVTSSAGSSASPAGATSAGGTALGGATSASSAPGGASTAAGGTTATTSSSTIGQAGATAQGGATGAGGAAGGSIKTTATSTGTSMGGATATGGTRIGGTTSGTGGTLTGGTTSGTTVTGGTRTGGTTSTGTSTGTGSWWPAAFSATTLPNPSNGNHNAGRACFSCHGSGGSAPSWLFGGTIYDSAGTTGVGHLQVGIKDGTKFFSAYSATNGNIWLPTASNTVNWANAEIRIRSATGEKIMPSAATSGDCNSCHSSGNRISTP